MLTMGGGGVAKFCRSRLCGCPQDIVEALFGNNIHETCGGDNCGQDDHVDVELVVVCIHP